MTFFTFRILFDCSSYSKKFNNINYFVTTYFIIIVTLIITYLFYYLYKKLNKTNG
jgi:hypothetical protein